MSKYVECSVCGNTIEEGSNCYTISGRSGIYCCVGCVLSMLDTTVRLRTVTEELAEDKLVDMKTEE